MGLAQAAATQHTVGTPTSVTVSILPFLTYRKPLVYGKRIKVLKVLILWGLSALASFLIPLSTGEVPY